MDPTLTFDYFDRLLHVLEEIRQELGYIGGQLREANERESE